MSKELPLVLRYATWLSVLFVWIAGGVLLLSAFMVTADVLVRFVFGQGIRGTSELSSYALAMVCAWALPLAQINRAHIRIGLLLPKDIPAVTAWLNVLALAAFAVFAFVLVRFGWGVFEDSLSNNSMSPTTLRMPLAIPQGIWAAGLILWFLVVLLLLVDAAGAALRRDFKRVDRAAGIDNEPN